MNMIMHLLQGMQTPGASATPPGEAKPAAGFAGLFGALLDRARTMVGESAESTPEDLQAAIEETATLLGMTPEQLSGLTPEQLQAMTTGALSQLGMQASALPMQPGSTDVQSQALATLKALIEEAKQTQSSNPTSTSKSLTLTPPSSEAGDAVPKDQPGDALPKPLQAAFVKSLAQQKQAADGNGASPTIQTASTAAPAPSQLFTPVAPGTQAVAAAASGPEAALAQLDTAPDRPALPPVVEVREVGNFAVKTVRYLSGRGEESITVRLVPRSLGELHIAMRSGSDGLELVMTVANHAARDTLELRIPELRDALARDGQDVTKVTVQTFTRGDAQAGRSGAEESAQRQTSSQSNTQHRGVPDEPNPDTRGSPKLPVVHDGSLNHLV